MNEFFRINLDMENNKYQLFFILLIQYYHLFSHLIFTGYPQKLLVSLWINQANPRKHSRSVGCTFFNQISEIILNWTGFAL